MIFINDDIRVDFAKELTDAMSFVFEADAEVEFKEPELIRKVLSTSTYSLYGEFAAGELYGVIRGKYVSKDGMATINEIEITIGDLEASSIVNVSTQAGILSSLTNAHQIYITRERNKLRQHESIQALCDKLEQMTKGLDNAKEFTNIITEIRQHLG